MRGGEIQKPQNWMTVQGILSPGKQAMKWACQGEKKTAQRRKGLPVRVLRIERWSNQPQIRKGRYFAYGRRNFYASKWSRGRAWRIGSVCVYFKQLYGLESDSRIFPLSKYALKRGMAFGCKTAGVKIIRIHDLRHSHVSLLINMGYSAVAIGNRVGHESVEITYRYAHLFPTVQKEMADKLNVERSN